MNRLCIKSWNLSLIVVVMFFMINSSLCAEGKLKKPSNETGWRFGKVDNNVSIRQKKKEQKLLEELLKVVKEQLKVQKDILAIMQKEFDPQPKEITLSDGTKCIANSSAKCFKMPVTPEASKIPALANLMNNPSKESAKNYLQWQAKYFNEVSFVANSMQFAVSKWGEEAYPTNFYRGSFDSATGHGGPARNKSEKKMVNAMGENLELFFFFGKDYDMDIFSFDAYAKLSKELPDIDITIVFYEEGSKEVFEEAAKIFIDLRKMLANAKTILVGKHYFSKFNIYATPTLASITTKNTKDKKTQKSFDTLLVGKMGVNPSIDKIIDILEYRKIVPPTMLPDYKIMRSNNGEVIDNYMKIYYGVDFNNTVLKEKYPKGGF